MAGKSSGGLKDWMHKFLRRWNATHSRYVYDGRRGVFENDQNMPASHPGKLTVVLDPSNVIFPPVLTLANPTDIAYVTMVQIGTLVGAAGVEKHSLRDAAGNDVLSFTIPAALAATEFNNSIGDGSAVIAQFQGNITAVTTHGIPIVTGTPILVTYYIRPSV